MCLLRKQHDQAGRSKAVGSTLILARITFAVPDLFSTRVKWPAGFGLVEGDSNLTMDERRI